MRFLRELVVKRRNGQKLRNKLKGKKKQKRLDAICERAYNRSHGGVENVESNEFIDGGNELELRRSSRARKVPVLLDSSPQPPKKRRKVDRSGVSSIEKVQIKDVVKCGTGDSSARDFDGHIGGWGTRLRSRGNNGSFSRRKRGESSPKGKRKLFEDLDGFRDDTDPQCNDEKDEFLCKKSKVVKSKRPGRIKASNDLEKENQEIDLRGGIENCKDNLMDDVFEPMDKEDEIPLRNKFDSRSELGVHDGCIPPKPVEEEATVQIESQVEECLTNSIVEMKENAGLEKLACDLEHQRNDIEVNCPADQAIEGPPDKLLEGEKCEKSVEKRNDLNAAEYKPRLKLGRRCGLCGGGTDGKPPKILLLDGDSSGNEAYSGSSASEESNYDVFDGFGDDSGWLGRLLGPINDRFGIAGIWVHQQCAVWSPEVYFAGLGCLKNVRAALYRGRVLKCNRCMRPGATIGCHVDRCPKTYHLPCARAKGCTFDHRKFLIACTDHGYPFQPYGMKNELRLKKIKSKKMKLELRKTSNGAYRKDIEAEEKWLENFGEDEEFLKRESKRLHRDLGSIAPVYIGGANSVSGTQFQGWESVAGLQGVIQCMKEVVILPLLYPEFFTNIGLTPPRGVLLHGYPGTGKTLVVRALVGACARGDKRIAYFARKGADCLGKYVGDAERQLRLLFQVAEKSQPSIIFFDEIDGLAPCRTKQQDQTHSSVVSTLLALMDGLKSRGSVVVIGATNRPDAVDPALRRPGRFDREIYFPLPSVKDREAILSLHTEKWPKPIAGSLLKSIAKQTIGYAGADLQALCTRAAIIALRKCFPLQEVLSTSKDEVSHSKYPSIPNFFVDERDWLQALTCAPPPCSRREYGIAVNDVFTSPLSTFLVPCLLQPLIKLLVCLYLDERVWLTPALSKASMLVKKVIVSALDDRRVPSDAWWSHIDDVLQDASVANEIEKNFLLADVLFGKTNLCSSDVTDEFDAETSSKNLSSNPQCVIARSGLLQNMSYKSSNKSGFQLLISGNPRSGQRHLASCLLHCFVGNVDVWKVDLASISHEGHGDMIQGLTRILMRCASVNMCMIYMPRIDLWAIYKESSKNHHESDSMEPESPGKLSSNGLGETDKEPDICSNAEAEGTESQNDLIKASYLWTSFIEHVESMRVNTSLIILATSELPFSTFPHRVKQFFGSEIVNCSLSVPMNHKVPRFCVQLDGNFDHDKIMKTAALMLTKDLAQQFIQSIQSRNHTQKNSLEEKDHDKVNDDHLSRKSSPVSPLNSVEVMNKTMKGKSSLLLAISTVGYQILCYPHFAELCWVTSKLKAGPFANISGPTKGWPFNSCIIHPIVSSTDKVVSPSGNSKSKESSVVRGLVAVGLSAYRGEYTSLREICSEVRKVLETLVGRIDNKIQAGKDGSQFFCLLSQVAYLEDMIISWAHNLRSLEADTPISEAHNVCTGSLDNHVSKDDKSDGDSDKLDGSNLIIQETEKPGGPLDIPIKCAGDSVPINGDNVCQHAPDEVPVASEDLCELGSFDPSTSCSVQNSSLPIVDNLQTSTESKFVGNAGSTKLFNGFMNFFDFQENGSCGPVNHGVELFPCTEVSNQPNVQSLTNNNILSTNTNESSRRNDFDANTATTLPSHSSVTCFYQCCSECFTNLYNLLLRIVTSEWGAKGGNDLTVEAIHDFVASLSVNLHLVLGKLSEDQSFSSSTCNESSKAQKYMQCRKSKETDMPECKNFEKNWIMTECSCHTSEGSTNKEKMPETSLENESTYVIKNGVLAPVETGIDIPYHCKFEKLCLCSVTEWLAMNKEPFD